jgi:hypothetical protein
MEDEQLADAVHVLEELRQQGFERGGIVVHAEAFGTHVASAVIGWGSHQA